MSSTSTPQSLSDTASTRAVWMYAPCSANSASQFGDDNNLHAWALPFEGHAIDPIELLEELGEYLDGRPGGCQRVTKNAVRDGVSVDDTFWENVALVEHAMLVHGWWLGGKTTVGRYYCNPDYYHRHPESDVATSADERRELFRKATTLGILTPSDIAPACGYASDASSGGSAVTRAAHRLGFDWSAERDAGRDRMARTWKTLSNWDYTYTQIGDAFGYDRRRVGEYLMDRAPDYEPPTDPTEEVVSQ